MDNATRRIWKFPLREFGGSTLEMPSNASIVHVAVQGQAITLWAECNPLRERVTRHFIVVGTGFDIPPDAFYIGTVHVGAFVWHVYEQKSQSQGGH